MKLPCAVVRDLLPLYAEKLTEPETHTLVEAHLTECPACRQALSQIETRAATPVETAQPLQALKKEIRKRRWLAVALAALCVFIALFTCFYHANQMQLLPWEEGLVEVKGVEARPREEAVDAGESQASLVDALILRVDARMIGKQVTLFQDEDGASTMLLQGWSAGPCGHQMTREYNELQLYPVPDRLIYDDGETQQLLWGNPMNGGVATLPRLALAYYIIAAAAAAVLFGCLWFLLRRRKSGRVMRQLFFAPVSYIVAHILIMGTHTITFFMERAFVSIFLIAAATYALLSLAWQVIRRSRALDARGTP